MKIFKKKNKKSYKLDLAKEKYNVHMVWKEKRLKICNRNLRNKNEKMLYMSNRSPCR